MMRDTGELSRAFQAIADAARGVDAKVATPEPFLPNRKARRAQAKADRKAPVLQYVGKRVLL